ncbi:MAG: hypothetical protein JWL62_2899 [Hyphomicrobiales bacterium]|nr:hypothetical protein [Hyphomicrobiales bacterium]
MKIIDTSANVSFSIPHLQAAGIGTVGRYYSSADWKRMTPAEARIISDAGLRMFAVFEDSVSPSLTYSDGVHHGQLAFQQATHVGQPPGSAIYFGLDSDLDASAFLEAREYFRGVKSAVGETYEVGVYADGAICGDLLDRNLCTFAWLSASRGYSGSPEFYESKRWALAQAPDIDQSFHGIRIDYNEASGEFGAFALPPNATAVAALENKTRPTSPDRFTAPTHEPPWLGIAKRELGVRDTPGPSYHPRVLEYLHTTHMDANDDETSWSSAFVNWCLMQAGFSGTGNAVARSWLTFGSPLPEPRPGCIVVLWRGDPSSWKGHVGFFAGWEDGGRVRLLAANQGGGVDWDEVCYASFPKERILGFRWNET